MEPENLPVIQVEYADAPQEKSNDRAGAPALSHRLAVTARIQALREQLHRVFSSDQSFVWEVGCGHGHFLTAYAAAHPAVVCVGIDIVRDRIDRARRKARRAKLPNVHFLIADAREFLEALPPAASFSSVYILFPDPWPKRRHHKNRLMQAPFLDAVAIRAEPRAPLYFRTDFMPYFTEATTAVRSSRSWELSDETWPFESDTVFQARARTYFSFLARRRT